MNLKVLARCTNAMFVLAGLTLLSSTVANAAPFRLTYNGFFDATDSLSPEGGPTTNFTAPTPFTFTAIFDTSSTNYVSFLPPFLQTGWVSYSPISATLAVGGETYSVDDFASNATGGVAVAIFDQSTIFQPGRYGVGFIQDPIADGAGIVGDFLGATQDFSAPNLVSTTYTGYQGAGFGAGPPSGARPITLRQGGNVFSLQLSTRTEEFSEGAPLHSASLNAIPEPGTIGLASLALTGLVALRRRRK